MYDMQICKINCQNDRSDFATCNHGASMIDLSYGSPRCRFDWTIA